jgi:hypothetical protein
MALDDFIKIARDQTAATEANELLQFTLILRQAYELGNRIRAKMRHHFDDSKGAQSIVWTDVETVWGIPAGKGTTIFTLIDGAIGSMEGAFQTSAAKDITETVG